MNLDHITFSGPPIDDEELLSRLPGNLRDLLQQINGFIQFHGGLHVRGGCRAPIWHSLRNALDGDQAFHQLYPSVLSTDVPFAEDCLGDQFLLRNNEVWHLAAETGELESLRIGLKEFFDAVASDPVEFLSLHPLMQFHLDGGVLEPGQLLAAYPPFCTTESVNGVVLRAIPTSERRQFLADLAAQLRGMPDGIQRGCDSDS